MMIQLFESLVNFFHDHPYIGPTLLFAAGLRIYYQLRVVRKVELDCKRGTEYEEFLVNHLPIIKEEYRPTFWCFEPRIQTIFASIIRQTLPTINYRREILKLKDGGEVCLDWLDTDSKDPKHPTILFMPGLTGDSQSEYIKSFVNVARRNLNARCVVFIYRGLGGNILKTPRAYCATDHADVSEVIDHINRLYPESPLTGLGVSLGGIMLGNYLKTYGDKAKGKLVSAFLVSVCWDTFKGSESIEKWGLNLMLNMHLAYCLVSTFKTYMHLFDGRPQCDLNSVLSSRTVKQFDSSFTAQHFGYKDVDAYYRDAMLKGQINKIKVPVLAISAEDDPFQPGESIPTDEAKESDHVAILRTKYGGHIGFMEGWLPTRYHFTDRLFAQFIDAVYNQNGSKILTQLSGSKCCN